MARSGSGSGSSVQRLLLACPRCGPRLERLDWLDARARVTRRLAQSVARLCAVRSLLQAARWFGLDWKTVKAIDFRHLEQHLGPIDLSGVTVIAMDEFAIQKGHRYATVVVDPERKRVLWVGRGPSLFIARQRRPWAADGAHSSR